MFQSRLLQLSILSTFKKYKRLLQQGGNSSVGRASDWKPRRNSGMSSSPSGGGKWSFLRESASGANCKYWFVVNLPSFLPSTTAVLSYAIGSRKLSANEQFFDGAQTVVTLLQTTHIIADVCFITDHVAYASSDETRIVWIETELFYYPGGCPSCLPACCAWALGCFYSHISTRTFRRVLTASVNSCAEIKSALSVA